MHPTKRSLALAHCFAATTAELPHGRGDLLRGLGGHPKVENSIEWRSELRRIFSGTGFFLLLNDFSGTGQHGDILITKQILQMIGEIAYSTNRNDTEIAYSTNDFSGTGQHGDILITKQVSLYKG